VLAREVAPLGIRGLSMLDEPIAPDYQATVSAVIGSIFGNPEAALGDPAKVAQTILRLAEEKQPPVRLLLGSDAVQGAAAAVAARAAEDARWEALSVSTDHDKEPA
jgi:hypothetical protein